jgi:nucleotide-binding universal stress UspA family protein
MDEALTTFMVDKDGPLGTPDPIDPLRISNILCPVDFSDYSNGAFGYAVSLATHFGSRLFLQHTVERAQYVFMAGVGPGVIPRPEAQFHSSREAIRRMLMSCGVDSTRVTTLLNQGDVAGKILETIAKESIDLVVMGTHGRKGFNRLFLGSVTEGIVHHAMCPVLAVSRPENETAFSGPAPTLKTILLATDFSPHSDCAAAYAMKWACEWGARLIMLHAVNETSSSMRGIVHLLPEYNPRFERQITATWRRIRQWMPGQDLPNCKVTFDARCGDPKEEILRAADETGADLIVTGARGTSRGSLLWGSVSSAVVRDGRFPVLVVREQQR